MTCPKCEALEQELARARAQIAEQRRALFRAQMNGQIAAFAFWALIVLGLVSWVVSLVVGA